LVLAKNSEILRSNSYAKPEAGGGREFPRALLRLDGALRLYYVQNMDLIVQIPDDLANRMSVSGGDLSRRALEAFALEEFRSGRIAKPDLRRLLGFGTRYRLDGFLKSHGVYEDYTMEDFEEDREALKQLGF
jgi:hypothetical protein